MLRDRPWLLGIGVSAAFLIFAGLTISEGMKGNEVTGPALITAMFAMVFAIFVRQEAVVLDRAAGEVIVRRSTIFGVTEKRHPLEGLRKAEAEEDTGHSKRRLTRPVLVYRTGPKVALSEIFSSGTGAETTAKAINDWLKPKG
jgi:hypothetical protein